MPVRTEPCRTDGALAICNSAKTERAPRRIKEKDRQSGNDYPSCDDQGVDRPLSQIRFRRFGRDDRAMAAVGI